MREDALYLLHLWCDSERVEDLRASLENVRTRERTNFASLEALQVFIAERTLRMVSRRSVSDRPEEGGT